MQRGELASPPGRNAVELFRGALELDPGNTLAKAGLVRVADRLLSAAERALTAGSAEDARKMVAVAESLTPATARGAFLMMQIESEHERTALTRAKDTDAQDRLEKGATYLGSRKRACAAARSSNPPKTTLVSTWKRRARSFRKTRAWRKPRAFCRRSFSSARRPLRPPAMPPRPNAGWRTPTAPVRRARK